jgi:ATP-dependent RNA helicase RhlE
LFEGLGLSAELTRAVAEQGYTQPTPVQVQAIPYILEGRDVLAGAQTGTGKTAGFTLPLLQRLNERSPAAGRGNHAVRALILTPTRELAAQVEESVRTYGKHLELSSALVYGGVGIGPQIAALKRGVDVLVATPGRLLDHVQQKTVDLSRVEILVLDEADRMLDMGFIHDIRRVLALLPKERQNLLFSATFSDEIRRLADGILRSPAMVEVARRNAESELVDQRVHIVPQHAKRDLLAHLIKTGDWQQVLVFTRTKRGANRLAEQLNRHEISATPIHGNKSQAARTKALAGFKAGSVRVLVATDIAARGLDIEELPHVVNYDMPQVAEDYVHRIGRTGRAGTAGIALSLVAADEQPLLTDIERLLGRKIDRETAEGFVPGAAPAHPVQEPREPRQPRSQNGQGRGRQAGRSDGNRQRSRNEGGRGQQRQADGNKRGGPQQRADSRNRGGQQRPAQEGRGRGQTADFNSRGPRPPDDEDRQPGNVAPRVVERPFNEDDERQPESNAGQLYPSSAKVYGTPSASEMRRGPRPQRGGSSQGGRPRQQAALLGGRRRSS